MNETTKRRLTRQVRVGNRLIGGDAPITVQSMTNRPASDFEGLYRQIKDLEAAGCDIVRMTVPDAEAVRALHKLKSSDIGIPIVADIHFDYRMAIESAAAGADKIRLNPGNIGGEDRVKAVVAACRSAGIPIRVGVNGGSLEKDLLARYGAPTPEALAESALRHIRLLEKFDFNDVVAAVKSSDAGTMIRAARLLAARCDYPLHLGVTEAGTARYGVLKSAVGIGSLLCDGIGDTIRVSLTDDPVREVKEGRALLGALGLDPRNRIRLVSCPTCGRTKIDLIGLTGALEERLSALSVSRPLTVAVMGCAVNGPGEAREADVGIAGGDGEALLFRHGEIVKKLPEDGLIDALIAEIERLGAEE